MKNYYLEIPITGIIAIEIEAETEQEAIKKAFDEITIDDILEWEAHENITQGNVFYGMLNSINVNQG